MIARSVQDRQKKETVVIQNHVVFVSLFVFTKMYLIFAFGLNFSGVSFTVLIINTVVTYF